MSEGDQNVFYKIITREGPLVCFQYESLADEAAYAFFDIPSSLLPAELIVNDNGLFSCWWRDAADEFYDANLARKAQEEIPYFRKMFTEYRQLLEKLEAACTPETPWSHRELLAVLEDLRRSCTGLIFAYSLPKTQGVPTELKELGLSCRRIEDRVGSLVRRRIRTTIEKLFPEPNSIFATSEELFSGQLPVASILAARAKECVIENGILLDESLKAHLARTNTVLAEEVTDLKTDALTGDIACRGVATGRVRIIRKESEVVSFLEGEVLVSYMTTPSFVPAMRKAAAIITDEGGITCHAAIVARELGKPCIIGTKIATKFLQDGDMVVVDANNGIVKKL